MATVYGIDLGTTFSCIAKINAEQNNVGRPTMLIKNRSCAFPSVVFFDSADGTPHVGDVAKQRMRQPKFASQTLAFFKTHMGEIYCPEKIKYQNKDINISPIEGSACILHHLYKLAESEEIGLGHESTNQAVITIPAGFKNEQRICTKIAAELAGIKVLALIHEPTAAAVSYDIKPNETIIVFDLGGGTLDVSIVNYKSGKYKVLASASDHDVFGEYIGGKLWDDAIMDIAVELRNDSESGLTEWNRDKNNRAMEGQLRTEAERCKIELSELPEVDFAFPDMETVTIKRATFERRTSGLVKKCMDVVEAALSQLGNSSNNIQRCVLAGGASNMPMIRTKLARTLNGKISSKRAEDEWLCVTRPDQAIAEGAAIYARQIVLGQANDTGIVIEEKSSHAYGTSINNNEVSILIKTTDPMVFEGEKIFYPTKKNQESIPVDVYECNSDINIPITEAKALLPSTEYQLPTNIGIDTNTEILFKVKRDVNGIIKINVSCGGRNSKDYETQTLISKDIISEDILHRIINSIRLMDMK